MDFSSLEFGVDGDSITAGEQWSYHVFRRLGFASHHNVAVGSAVWYKRTIKTPSGSVTTQDYDSPDFAGISGGWLETDDPVELQMRANNCAVVHIQHFLADVRNGIAPKPDVFAFAMGTNDDINALGDPEKALRGKSLENNKDIDLFTEAGAMRWCIQTIAENFPDARIFVLTPIQTATPEHNAKIETQITKIFRPVTGAMSVRLIDCFHESGICEKFEVIGGEGRYLRDGLHPMENGQALEGAFAANEIRNHLFYAEDNDMTFDELLAEVRKKAENIDASGVDFLAVQVNITGDNGGVFYVEIKNGKVSIEPYPYNDKSCEITISGDNFLKLINGKLDAVAAFTLGKLKVGGDLGKALEFSKLLKK